MRRSLRLSPKSVFLSHSSKDRAFVEKLANVLASHRIPVWYSRVDIQGAKQWHDEIGRGLKNSDWLVVVLSPNSVKSPWVKHEVLFALRSAKFNNRIVPVLLKDCKIDDLSWTLENFQIVSFIKSFPDECRNLLKVWGRVYDPKSIHD